MIPITVDTAINFEHLRRYTGDDDGLMAELFSLFQHQADMWGKSMSSDNDDEMWYSIMHSLKGTANAIGALKLANCCEKAELLVGDAAKPIARQLAIQDITSWIEAVIHRIQRWEYHHRLSEVAR